MSATKMAIARRAKTEVARRALRNEAIVDEIKNAIDEGLRKLATRDRLEQARELIEYIELHHVDAIEHDLEGRR